MESTRADWSEVTGLECVTEWVRFIIATVSIYCIVVIK
jgi:hypothetical protein